MCKIRKMFLAVIMGILIVTGTTSNASEAVLEIQEDKIIRVGYPMQNGLSMKDEKGNYSGYTYEYLQEVSQYTGWTYEFVEVPGEINESLTTMLEMLDRGEIDILGGMVRNEYTQEKYGFPEYEYGFSYLNFKVPIENEYINENNYQTIEGLKIACFSSSKTIKDKVSKFCHTNNIEFEYVYFDTNEEASQMLRNGEADILIEKDLNPWDDLRTIAKFAGEPFYFAVAKEEREILAQLNNAILSIQQIKPEFESSLYDKYFSNNTDQMFFSKGEEEYLQTAAPVRLIMMEEMAPIQFVDEEGNFAGVAVQLCDSITEKTGLQFEFIPAENYKQASEMLENNQADAVFGIPYDYQYAKDQNMMLTSNFLTAQSVMILKSNVAESSADMSNKIVGVAERGQTPEKSSIGDIQKYANSKQCLDAVLSGEIDYAYLDLYSAEFLLHKSEYSELRLIPQWGKTIDFCMGIKKPVDVNLVSIINKVLRKMPEGELETILFRNSLGDTEEITLKAIIEANPYASLGLLSSLFLILILIGLYILSIRIRNNKRLHMENQKYQHLSQLANEYIYEYSFVQDSFTFSREFAQLFTLPDKLTYFKEILQGKHYEIMSHDMAELLNKLVSETKEAEYLCTLPNGEQKWYRNTKAEIRDSDGKIKYIIGKITDIQTEKEEKERLEQKASLDGLTEIYNAVSAKNIITKKLQRVRKTGALLIMDLDHFKDVNDKLGHYMGDVVLKEFAQMLKEAIGEWDIAGRLGGDEFVAYIDDAEDLEKIKFLCDKLCKKSEKTYTNSKGAFSKVTISMGCAIAHPGIAFSQLYQNADKYLYESKKNGRNCYTMEESK